MRKVNRVVGGLVISGVGFVGLATLLDFTNAASWLGWLFLAIGIGLLFVGRHYYFRLPLVILDERQKQAPRQPFASFVAAHRRELSVLAQIGLAVSLFRLVGLFFGSNWPGGWGTWLLGGGSFALASIAPMWPKPWPKSVSWILRIYWNVLTLSVALVVPFYVNHQPWPLLQQGMNILVTGLLVLFYGGAAVGFVRRKIQPVNVEPAE